MARGLKSDGYGFSEFGHRKEIGLESPPPSPVAIPGPSSASFPIQVPPSHPLSVQVPPVGPPFDENSPQKTAPGRWDRGEYNRLTYDELRQLRRQRAYARKGSKAEFRARLSSTDAVER